MQSEIMVIFFRLPRGTQQIARDWDDPEQVEHFVPAGWSRTDPNADLDGGFQCPDQGGLLRGELGTDHGDQGKESVGTPKDGADQQGTGRKKKFFDIILGRKIIGPHFEFWRQKNNKLSSLFGNIFICM